MAVDPRSVTWCAECDWNVDPLADKTPPTKRAVRRQRRADRAAQSQFDRLVQSPVDRPYRGPVWFAALALATSVHLLTLAIAIGGVLAVVSLPLLSKLLVGVPAFAVTAAIDRELANAAAEVAQELGRGFPR